MSHDFVQTVREFMLTFRQSAPGAPTMPSPEALYARHQMLVEESREIAEAGTREQLLDGIVDALYVTYGTAVAAGFTDEQIRGAFSEVHRSNMSKRWPDEMVDARPPNTFSIWTPGGWVVKRSDGKVIKYPGYSAPDLKPFLN